CPTPRITVLRRSSTRIARRSWSGSAGAQATAGAADPRLMSRVGARREREGTVPRATAVPRLAKPARHAGYAPGAHRSIGGCRRSGEAASLRRAGQASPQMRRRGGRTSSVAPALPAATCGARGSPSVPFSRPVPTRDVSRVGLLERPRRHRVLSRPALGPPVERHVVAFVVAEVELLGTRDLLLLVEHELRPLRHPARGARD